VSLTPVPNEKYLQAEKIDTFFGSSSLSGVSSLILFPQVPSIFLLYLNMSLFAPGGAINWQNFRLLLY
jgi:hypothetical protein